MAQKSLRATDLDSSCLQLERFETLDKTKDVFNHKKLNDDDFFIDLSLSLKKETNVFIPMGQIQSRFGVAFVWEFPLAFCF